MTLYFESEVDVKFDFDCEALALQVAEAVTEAEGCPYACQVNVLLTDNAGIMDFNSQYRGIAKETDVLSFPNIDFPKESDFSLVEDAAADCFDPDSGELILGDIILSADRIISQAAEYGHSPKREFAFLVAHSMFHLCGYDHVEEAERLCMEEKQEAILQALGIAREG